LKDLFAVRAALEGLAAQSAAESATPAELATIRPHPRSLEHRLAQGRSSFSENRAFHLAIAEASHNAVLVNCLAMVIGGLGGGRGGPPPVPGGAAAGGQGGAP